MTPIRVSAIWRELIFHPIYEILLVPNFNIFTVANRRYASSGRSRGCQSISLRPYLDSPGSGSLLEVEK